MYEKAEMVCGEMVTKPNIARHRKSCRHCKTIKYLKEEVALLRSLCKVKSSEDIVNGLQSTMDQTQGEYRQIDKENGGCLYIIQTRESIRLEENVYKIGKTCDIQKRLNSYPKGSSLYKMIKVSDRHLAEKLVLREFRQKFIKREEMGNEYFQGNLQEMMQIFDEFERIIGALPL